MIKIFLTTLTLSASLFAYNTGIDIGGFSFSNKESNLLQGSEKVIEKLFLLREFTQIELDSSIDITVKKALKSKYIIMTDDNLIDVILVEQKGQKIRISSKVSYQTNSRLHLTIFTKKLNYIKIKGNSYVNLNNLNEDRLMIDIDGAIDLKASGKLNQLEMTLDGAYDVDLENLTVQKAEIEMSGSGDALIYVEDSLEAKVSGNASLVYLGEAKIRKEILDNGEIEKND